MGILGNRPGPSFLNVACKKGLNFLKRAVLFGVLGHKYKCYRCISRNIESRRFLPRVLRRTLTGNIQSIEIINAPHSRSAFLHFSTNTLKLFRKIIMSQFDEIIGI